VGTATLGFAGGPAVAFRIDPDAIDWNFEVLTSVTETIGGRVIQVIGSRLEDMTVTGSFGQDHSTPQGESWRQAEAFLSMIQQIMDFQSSDATDQTQMHPPAVFTYPPKNWRFNVYVKGFDDADNPGTSIVMTPGKFNQRWQLTLFIVQDSSTALVQAGESNGVLDTQAQAAIAAYMARISAGIGWTFSQYTGLANSTQLNNDIAAELALNPQAYDLPGASAAAGTGTSTASGGATPVDSSETAFISAVLSDIGAPATTANVNSLASWFKHEFPSWPPAAQYNPMATTQVMPGSTNFNELGGGQGVQNYPDAKTGATATATALTNGYYPDIVKALRAGTGICGGGFASELSTWSGGGYTSVC
jgi:hypothetical protein